MMETELVNLIGNVGFPIAVSVYFMFRLDKLVQNNTKVLNKVLEVLEKKN